jgi:hypothetical protein
MEIYKPESISINKILLLGLFIGLLLINHGLKAATYYIDPASNAGGTPDGSIDHPFLSWDKISWVAGSSYFQKRGTICETTTALKPTAPDITLGAYGTGERPIIKSQVGAKSKGIDCNQASFTVNDLEIYSVNDIVCAIIFGGAGPYVINSCVLHDCSWGVRALGITGKLTISNTEIYNIGDDGVFCENVRDIEIFGCYIHHVNADLPIRETAGGDCIQIAGEQGYTYIHDNILDHSAFGRKFCIIIGSADVDADAPDSALIENNTMIGFQSDTEVTSSLYLKESISHLIFRYNTIKDAATGIWGGSNFTAYNNIFIRCWQGIQVNSGKIGNIYNNTFCNNKNGVVTNYSSTSFIYNNIFNAGDMTTEHFLLYGNVTSNYNCFNTEGAGLFGGGINTLAELQQKKGRELHSVVADPQFIDLAAEDFHITETSPCIDKGVILSEITRDKDGNVVPVGAGSDIGAYEYSVTKNVTFLNEKQKQEFQMFPNPASDYFFIQLDHMEEHLSVQVINLNGKVVMENNLTNVSEAKFCSKSFEKGIYYVRLLNGKNIFEPQKLIIQ